MSSRCSSPVGSCDLAVSSSYHFLWRREPISKEEEEEETSGESSGLGYAADDLESLRTAD